MLTELDIKKILSSVDHTLLSPTATWEEIKAICDDGVMYNVASVCIAPAYVKRAAMYLEGRLPVCTVVGFPNGYSTTTSKCFEASEAIANGASEIDMVINQGMVRDGDLQAVLEEIKQVKRACGNHVLKVIVETCLLSEEEKIKLCKVVSESGADFIKTSTGFSSGGATKEDISLFAANVENGLKIKAAGGIRSLQDAWDFLLLGADRLGTSSVVKIIKNESLGSY